MRHSFGVGAAFLWLSWGVATGQLIQLAEPGETMMTLQPGSTRALVRETRTLFLPTGESAIAFSWNAAKIDAASVTVMLERGQLAEATRPAGQEKTLIWQIRCLEEGPAKAVISYIVEGVKWQPQYLLRLDLQKERAILERAVRLTNETGVTWRNVQLEVVGSWEKAWAEKAPASTRWILGPLTLEAGATIVAPGAAVSAIPMALRYSYEAEQSPQVQRWLELRLQEAGLTAADLPEGPLMVVWEDETLTPLAQTTLSWTPEKELRIGLGAEPDIVVERKVLTRKRSNFDFDRFGRVAGLDTTEEVLIVARNHLLQPVCLEIVETMLSTWEWKGPKAAEQTASVVRWRLSIPENGAAEHRFTVIKHAGTRAKK